MKIERVARRNLLVASAALLLTGAQAQTFPDKPLKLVVPFGAGTTTDIVARTVAPGLAAALGQSVVIENRAGGGGSIGVSQVVRSPADGYTLLMGTASTHGVNPSLYRKLPYDAQKDFVPVGFVGYTSNLLVVAAGSPLRNLADLRAAASKPGGITFSSAGAGTTGHLSAEMLKMKLGGQMVHVPYKDGGQALTDLIAGQVQFMFYHPAAVMPHVTSNRLRVLGISSAKRSAVVPAAVPIAEQGYPDFDLITWFMLYAPAATPQPVLEQLRAATRTALASPEAVQKFTEQGIELRPMLPAEMVSFGKAELGKWSALVQKSGATLD